MSATSAEARDKQAEVQGQLCGVLQVIVQKLSEENDTKAAVLQYADSVSRKDLSMPLLTLWTQMTSPLPPSPP